MFTAGRDPIKDLALALGIDHWELIDAVMRSDTFISTPDNQDQKQKELNLLKVENDALKEKLLRNA